MFESNLEMLLAMQDDDFQKILQKDDILNQLEKAKFSIQQEYTQLMYTFSGKIAINEIQFNVLTLGIWCFLYSIKNRIVCGEKGITETDIDTFLYLLHKGYQGVSDSLFEDAKDFCLKHEIDYTTAQITIHKLIVMAFRPFEMLPSQFSSNERSRFNLDWLTSIVSTVCRMVNCERQYALYKMSMTEAFYYVVQHLRQNDVKGQIRRRNSDQINAEIYKRTFELGKMYYETKYKNR